MRLWTRRTPNGSSGPRRALLNTAALSVGRDDVAVQVPDTDHLGCRLSGGRRARLREADGAFGDGCRLR